MSVILYQLHLMLLSGQGARNEGILDGLNVVSIEIEMRKPAEEFGCL